MNFNNKTGLEGGWTLGFERDGREVLIIAIKATYVIPLNGHPAQLATEQVPLVEADEFTGEPGLSAPLYETDYSQKKPYCDVLLNGSAHAPHGIPAKKVKVSLSVGDMSKSFVVTGKRFWIKRFMSVDSTDIEEFVQMPISYDNAYGGVDESDSDNIKTFVTNPVGCGYLPKNRDFDYLPMPNTEEIGRSISSPNKNYNPMSFGPIGRSWTPRYTYAGTYDDNWLNTRCPFFPDDFNYRYFQSAPVDQQIAFPQGGERVELINLSKRNHIYFNLPTKQMPILMIPKKGKAIQKDGVLDTIVIEPDKNRFMLTWRVTYPLRRNMFELKEIMVDTTAQDYEEYLEFTNSCVNC